MWRSYWQTQPYFAKLTLESDEMSADYYLICEEKKVYMPIFTMVMGSCSLSSKNWMFDFIMKTGHSEVKLVSEHVIYDMGGDEEKTLEEQGWEFMNAWHRQ